MIEENEPATTELTGDLDQDPVVLRGVLVRRPGAEQQPYVWIDRKTRKIDVRRIYRKRPVRASEMRQLHQVLAIATLRVRGFEVIRREVIVERRQPRRLWMSPRGDLHRCETQASELDRQRIYANRRID